MKRIVLLLLCMAGNMLQAQIIHVPVDYPTIQQGIEAANPGDTVLVSNGTYNERINFIGKKPLTVASEFILDGDWSHIPLTVIDGGTPPYPNNSSVVSFVSGEDTTSVLCGFTIKNGRGTLYESGGYLLKAGGGVFIKTSGASIIHNHITENHLANSPLGSDIDVFNGAGIAVAGIMNTEWVIIEYNTVDYNSCTNNTMESSGAGISVWCNAQIKYNLVSNNTCIGQQSCFAGCTGIMCGTWPEWNMTLSVTVQGNTISNNLAQADLAQGSFAGVVFQHITGIFKDNLVSNNEAHDNDANYGGVGGVGIIYPQEGTIISGNTFSGNISNGWCGALDFETYTGEEVNFRILVENNYFLDNQALRGGAIASANVPLTIQNNVFRGNKASTMGGAVLLSKALVLSFHHMAEMINNSFYHNTAENGGAIYSYFAKPLVFNNIFWKDSATVGPEIYIPSYIIDTVEIANSNIDFNSIYGRINDGGNNISQDPLYDDLDLLTLLTNSPCIDDGIETFICDCGLAHNCPGYDIVGNLRPQSGGVEMGAHELLFEGVMPDVNRQSSVVSYPNPFSDYTTFEYELEKPGMVTLTIFNHLGQQVNELVNEQQQKGKHQVQWNAEGLPAGVYFYRMTTDDYRLTTGKLVIAR